MAESIKYNFDEMRNVAGQIDGIAESYRQAASKFQSDFQDATAAWEGASKDKMQAFITGAVNEYMSKTVPEVVTALAELLRANADQMEKADQQIADNIPSDLGS